MHPPHERKVAYHSQLPPGSLLYDHVCSDCHTPASFQEACLPNHPTSLEGMHASAPCTGCHADDQPAPDLTACADCHQRPEHHLSGECTICRTPQGWAECVSFIIDLTPSVLHELAGRENCLACHELEGEIKPAPFNHGPYLNEQCALCHK